MILRNCLSESLFPDKKLSFGTPGSDIYGRGHKNVKHRDKRDEIRNGMKFREKKKIRNILLEKNQNFSNSGEKKKKQRVPQREP